MRLISQLLTISYSKTIKIKDAVMPNSRTSNNLFYDLDGKERMTSEAFRFLFNKKDEFYNHFFAKINLHPENSEQYECIREYWFKNDNEARRADLVIYKNDSRNDKNSHIIFIENKIWHFLEREQLEAYLKFLRNEHDIKIDENTVIATKKRHLVLLFPKERLSSVNNSLKKLDLLTEDQIINENGRPANLVVQNNKDNTPSIPVYVYRIFWESLFVIDTNIEQFQANDMSKTVIDSVKWMLSDYITNKLAKYSKFNDEFYKNIESGAFDNDKENEPHKILMEVIKDIFDQLGGPDERAEIERSKAKQASDYWGFYISNKSAKIWLGFVSEKCSIYQYEGNFEDKEKSIFVVEIIGNNDLSLLAEPPFLARKIRRTDYKYEVYKLKLFDGWDLERWHTLIWELIKFIKSK